MTDVGIDPDGEAVWNSLAHDLGVMLIQLLGAPAARVAEHDAIPSQPGVYLFSQGDRTVMVGLAKDLGRALHAAVNPDAEGGNTYLCFYLARWMAKRSGVGVDCDREALEADPEFVASYSRAKEIVPQLPVRFITHRDFLERQLLALYSEIHLNPSVPRALYSECDAPALFNNIPPVDHSEPRPVTMPAASGGDSIGKAASDRPVLKGIDVEEQNHAPDRSPRPSQILLGRAFKCIRNEKHLTQEQVAGRAGIHETYLGVIEAGRRNPTWRVLIAISAALEVPIAALVARAEES
jgi:DNA-binding XRE family transcriptional regulator